MNWGSWLDEYDREARLVPALLVILPLVLVATGLGFDNNPIVISVVGVLLAVGAPMVVAKQVADRGRAVEKTLFSKWGGPPTTLMLVPPADGTIGDIRQQRRARLEQVSGITLPTSPTLDGSTIETYQVAVRWLIENTRERTKFPVVWSELKTYGFERNALGVRGVGMMTSGISAFILLGLTVAAAYGANFSVITSALLTAVVAVVGFWWWRIPGEGRVRTAADRYAERILDASALLVPKQP